jgi:hypothetical protein
MKYLFQFSLLALLLTGCTSQAPVIYRPIPEKKPKPAPKPVTITPVKPTKIHELKEVQDDNFNPEYMYPETPKPSKVRKKQPVEASNPAAATETMSKEACIEMIGQEKFDKYTHMLGSEAGAIKRCIMLKAMK